MPQQNQKQIRSKNFEPSMEDFLGTDDPVAQRAQILSFASLQNAQLSAAFINAGGSWEEWDNSAAKACDINRKTTEVFTRAVNGNTDAISQIASDLDMPADTVTELLGYGKDSVSVGEQHYSEVLTMRDLIPVIGKGTGLYQDAL